MGGDVRNAQGFLSSKIPGQEQKTAGSMLPGLEMPQL